MHDTLVTVNCTAWSSFTGFLEAGAGGADLLMVQEHHLEDGAVAREEAWARGVGWSAKLGAATPTGRGGTSGGVGLLTRCHRGLGRAHGTHSVELVPGRAVCCLWNGGIPGGLVVVSAYLVCGTGMGEANWEIVKTIASELRVLGRPFVLGGDFQQSPEELVDAGVMRLFDDAEIVRAQGAGAEAGGTCCTKGQWSTIDFFLVSRALLPKIVSCELVLDAAIRPHRPVALTLQRGGHLPLQRVLAGPRPFPRTRPIGPARRPQTTWVRDDAAVNCVETVAELDDYVGKWFEAAEEVLMGEFDVDPAKARWFQGRGGRARFKWERPAVKTMRGRAKTSTSARAWFWLADRLGEIAKLPMDASGGRWEHRQALVAKIRAWCPPTGLVDVRGLWCERLRGVAGAGCDQVRLWQGLAMDLAEAEHAAFDSARRRQTRAWIAEICAGAAAGAHKVTKVPAGWRPAQLGLGQGAGGGRPLARQEYVTELAITWRRDIWGTRAAPFTPEQFDGMVDEVLPRPTVAEVKAAARKFPEHTGLGADQWHPRHFDLLPAALLESWVDIMTKAESMGWLPAAMDLLTIVFIPKGVDSVRPIGLFTASQRLWGKLRRRVAEQWEKEHVRDYWWGGTGHSVESCVWQQGLNGEYAAATGRKAASVLLDLVKAYETLGHRMCAMRFREAAVPLRYARWCLRCYAGPRVLRVDGAFSEVFSVDSSIVAGCAGATTLLKAVLLKTCDLAVARALDMATVVKLFVVVDDVTIQGVSAGEAAKDLYEGFEQDMCDVTNAVVDDLENSVGGTVSEEKSVVIGSSREVVAKIVEGTGRKCSSATATRNLGVDFSYVQAAAKTQSNRIEQAKARVGRFAFLRSFGGQVAAVVRAGPLSSMVFGGGVQGASAAALARMRTTVGACAFGPLGGSSLTLRFLTARTRELDPAFAMTLAPLKMWAMAVWTGSAELLRKMAIAFSATQAKVEQGASLEHQAAGPTVAVMIALRRLGWRAENLHTWVSDRGVRLPLRTICPRSMLIHGRLAVERWQWRHVAEQYPLEFPGFDHGGDLAPLRAALGPRSRLSGPQRSLVKNAAVRRLWPDQRRAEAGYQESGACAACGDELGSLRHALYRCPAIEMNRYCEDLGLLGVEGASAVDEHHLFSRGILQDIRHLAPSPDRSGKVVWDPAASKGYFEGHVFVDGSRLHGGDPLLARAGWGAAEVRVVNEVVTRAWGPLPGLVQCIDAAEVHAVTMVLRFGVPPLHVYSDSEFFVHGWRRGQAWCEAPGRAHADVWRTFWRAAEDFGGAAALTVSKVKAHATQAMVDGNLISEIDRWGNQVADEAAKRGAACHPNLDGFMQHLAEHRARGEVGVRWLGVGLLAAQRAGALPEALTMSQKTERPCTLQLKRVEVIKDATWWAERRRQVIFEGAHPSHAMHQVGPYQFCAVCGHHGAQRLRALTEPCPRITTPSRKYLLKRMLAGLHPRTGEYLGEVVRGESHDGPRVGAGVGLSATMRASSTASGSRDELGA